MWIVNLSKFKRCVSSVHRLIFMVTISLTLRYVTSTVDTSKVPERYRPDWSSIDSRPLPSWYDESKLGIFVHWGVFSVPSFGSEWFWWNWKNALKPEVVRYMHNSFNPNFGYADFGPRFTAELFNATDWARLFRESGARYVVLTSKHHDGFAMWPSNYSWNWNAATVGPKRDLVGELAEAVRRESIRFGVYHSFFEWFHPLWNQDKANNFSTNLFVKVRALLHFQKCTNILFAFLFVSF